MILNIQIKSNKHVCIYTCKHVHVHVTGSGNTYTYCNYVFCCSNEPPFWDDIDDDNSPK